MKNFQPTVLLGMYGWVGKGVLGWVVGGIGDGTHTHTYLHTFMIDVMKSFQAIVFVVIYSICKFLICMFWNFYFIFPARIKLIPPLTIFIYFLLILSIILLLLLNPFFLKE